MTAKIAIEKTQIAELALIPAPNYEINETNQRIIKRWLTTRYDRAAFPDTFNDLMRESMTLIKKLSDSWIKIVLMKS